MLAAILAFAFGSPRAALYLRTLAALSRLVPCAVGDDACQARHHDTARAIAIVAANDSDAAALVGLCAHETRCATVRQARGGPARSVWQIEPSAKGIARAVEADLLERDSVYAAQRALAIWGDGNAGAYACGDARRCPDAAAELRRYVERAEWAMAQ